MSDFIYAYETDTGVVRIKEDTYRALEAADAVPRWRRRLGWLTQREKHLVNFAKCFHGAACEATGAPRRPTSGMYRVG